MNFALPAPPHRTRSARPIIEPLEPRIAPAVFIVTSTADSGPGTLRNALSLADNHPGHNTILFNLPAPPAHGANVIMLTSGALISNGNVTIQGPGAGKLIIDANYSSGVFVIGAGITSTDSPATITGLSIIDGKVNGQGSGINGGAGAGIYSYESLTLKDVVISGNVAATVGGGVAISGYAAAHTRVNISNSLITGNYATDGAGGLSLYRMESITISNTVVTGNTTGATGKAGGVYAQVTNLGHSIAINGSVISGNTAGTAGGLFVADYSTARSARVTISRTRITGNTATGTGSGYGAGGGLFVLDGNTVITRSTIEGNKAAYYGGGVAAMELPSLTISRSIISGNKTTKAGRIYSGGGGLLISDAGSDSNTPLVAKIFDSRITDNQTPYSGGGIYVRDGVALTISRSIFSGDQAGGNGGALCTYGLDTGKVSLSITRSTFSGNAAVSGGGIYAGDLKQDGAGGVFSISSSRITGNSSVNGGGGIYVNGSASLNIKTSIIDDNIAGSYGGGLSIAGTPIFRIFGGSINRNFAENNSGGGINIALYQTGKGIISDVTISGNVTTVGGGIFNDGLTPAAITLYNDKISGNIAPDGPNLEDIPGDLSTFRFL